MRKTIFGLLGAALLLTAFTASSATLGSDNRNSEYGIDHFTPWNGVLTNAVILANTTNLIGTFDVTKHDQFFLIFSSITPTNQVTTTNTVTLKIYSLATDSTTAVPGLRVPANPWYSAAFTYVGAANTRVTNTYITNLTIGTIGYERLYLESSGTLILSNVYIGRGLKPQRDGSN